jgi:hypothetical protein
MLKRCVIDSERDRWALLCAAAAVLTNYRELLAHPSLDVSPGELEEYEADGRALAELLPAKVRLAVEEEGAARAQEAGAAPF